MGLEGRLDLALSWPPWPGREPDVTFRHFGITIFGGLGVARLFPFGNCKCSWDNLIRKRRIRWTDDANRNWLCIGFALAVAVGA